MFLLFQNLLLGWETRSISRFWASLWIVKLTFNKTNVWISPLQIHSLCIFFDLYNVIKNTLVNCLKATWVLSTFNFSRKVHLSHHELSKKLEFSNLNNLRQELGSDVGKVFHQNLVVLKTPRWECLKILADNLVMLHKIVYKHFVILFTFEPEIIRDLSSSNMVSIVSLELLCVTDNSVCDQSIKTLQECGSQMLMQKVNIS